MQRVGSIVHLRNDNRSQNTKPEARSNFHELARNAKKSAKTSEPKFSGLIYGLFQEDEGMSCLTSRLTEVTPNQYYSINPWFCGSRWRKWPLLQSLCHIDDKNLNASLFLCCWPGEISYSCFSCQSPQKSKSEFLLGMWNTHNGTCTPTSESPSPISKDQFELGKTSQNGHEYNKCSPYSLHLCLCFLPNGTCSICSILLRCS